MPCPPDHEGFKLLVGDQPASLVLSLSILAGSQIKPEGSYSK